MELYREQTKFALLSYWKFVENDNFERIGELHLEAYKHWVRNDRVSLILFMLN